jgi:hypothetical protein
VRVDDTAGADDAHPATRPYPLGAGGGG